MKNLLNLESPLMQMLTRIGDMILLNVLFLICSLPVITLGASLAALHKMLQEIVYDVDSSTVKGFFRAFRANFKQATVVWLFMLLIFVSLFCDYLLIITYFSGTEAVKWMLILLAVLAVLVICVISWLFPLLVRYENKLRQLLNNAIILSIIKLPRTIGLVALTLMPLIILSLSLNVFIQTLIFWVFIGFSFITYMQVQLLKSVFAELEQGPDSIRVGK
ncbi:MAG: YesL family protein [Oscillospiraceae bacterium]|nr:YesL family protein [Oscillospiraceae bacterium]